VTHRCPTCRNVISKGSGKKARIRGIDRLHAHVQRKHPKGKQ
jgi:hypothetical protein